MKKNFILLITMAFVSHVCAQSSFKLEAVSHKKQDVKIVMVKQQNELKEAIAAMYPKVKDNPLVKEWNTPYQTPPFDKIKDEHYEPAFEYALLLAKADVLNVALNEDKPTFENTIVALDRSGALLNRISNIFFNMFIGNTTPDIQKLAQTLSPKLTEFENSITLNPVLFKRVQKVYDNNDWKTEEEQMLTKKYYRNFVNSGALLDEKKKSEYEKLTVELSKLSMQFNDNVLAATNDFSMTFPNQNRLKGIPQSALEAAADRAAKKGEKGYIFDLSTPSYLAVLKYAEDREIRQTFFMASATKCLGGNFDNSEIIRNITSLRMKIAQLLGFEDYASYVLTDRMAGSKERVYEFLKTLSEPSRAAAEREMESLVEFAREYDGTEDIQRWDVSYYSEKQKSQLYKFDENELKAYFTVDNVIEGVFGLATRMYGLTFKLNTKIPAYQKDVKAYEVKKDGKLIAILYLDFYPRDNKKGGAWMTSFRDQCRDEKGNNVIPLVSLVMNFSPATSNTPALLTYDELTTFMHEFGHALHGMLSDVTYLGVSGTSVPRDFVELPSQINENWASAPEFLQSFAKHYKTGKAIPTELIQKIKKMENFQAGYLSCRQISYALLDMAWHDAATMDEDILSIEKNAMQVSDFFPAVEKTCMSTSFSHIFSGGYAAGYYSYKWAEVLDADAFSKFQEKGIFDKKTADEFYKCILSKGGSREAEKMFEDFRGRAPQVDALLKRSGLK